MFDGVMILVLVLEHNLSTLEELEGPTIHKVEVVVIHSVYHWTLTILNTNLAHKQIHIYMEQNMTSLMQ